MVIYSHLPRQSYSIEYEGTRWGIGLHRIFDVVEGAWNLMYLVAGATLDSFLTYTGKPEAYPVSLTCLPICVATALQYIDNSAETWNDLLCELHPAELITCMEQSAEIPLLFRQYGDSVLELMYKNAANFSNDSNKIVRINFQTKQMVH